MPPSASGRVSCAALTPKYWLAADLLDAPVVDDKIVDQFQEPLLVEHLHDVLVEAVLHRTPASGWVRSAQQVRIVGVVFSLASFSTAGSTFFGLYGS